MYFFAFEGVDEVGKTSLINDVYNILSPHFNIIKSSDENNFIGEIAKQNESTKVNSWFLWLEARKRECNTIIEKNDGKENSLIVLYDRYWYTTCVYADKEEYIDILTDTNIFIQPDFFFLITEDIDKLNHIDDESLKNKCKYNQKRFRNIMKFYENNYCEILNSRGDFKRTVIRIVLMILSKMGIKYGDQQGKHNEFIEQLICCYCQYCCQRIGIQTNYPFEDEFVEFYSARGFTCVDINGKLFVYRNESCPYLSDFGCKIYNNRPKVCMSYDGRVDFGNKCLWSVLKEFHFC